MGWGLKIVLIALALAAAGFGVWIVTAPILALLIIPPLLRMGGRRRAATKGGMTKRSTSVVPRLGVLLVLLSIVALYSGGTYSPLVFLLAGLAALLWGRVRPRLTSSASPVKNSALLRNRLLPFRWSMVAEAKISTRDLAGALSSVNGTILITSYPIPRIFLIQTMTAFTKAGAQVSLALRFRAAACALVPMGVYLLPLDTADAAEALSSRRKELKVREGIPHHAISSADYAAAAVKVEDGLVSGFSLYSGPQSDSRRGPVLPVVKERAGRQLTTREFLNDVRQHLGTPQPDRYVSFLGSLAATEGEDLGQRITGSQAPNDQVLLLESVGSPRVELSRAQLRVLITMYP